MPTRLLARSEAQRCAHCDVFVPAGKMQQHAQGKRHLSMLWYGRDGHRVRDIELYNDDGTLERRFRPFDVPERTVEAVRRANDGRRYTNEALDEARAKHAAAEEAERQAFASAVSDWRKGSGPVIVEREAVK